MLKRTGTLPSADDWLKRALAQLDRVAELPPDWGLQYGQQIIAQAQSLWPDNPSVRQLQIRWHEGMMQLQALDDKRH